MAYNVFYKIKGEEKFRILRGVIATQRGAEDFCRHYIELKTGQKVTKASTKLPPEYTGEVCENLPAMTEEHRITLHADWIKHLQCYRLHFPWDPAQTVAYVDTIEEAIAGAEARGYKVKVNE